MTFGPSAAARDLQPLLLAERIRDGDEMKSYRSPVPINLR
jgi:hypothetical protein